MHKISPSPSLSLSRFSMGAYPPWAFGTWVALLFATVYFEQIQHLHGHKRDE